jgi:hypothetical protein
VGPEINKDREGLNEVNDCGARTGQLEGTLGHWALGWKEEQLRPQVEERPEEQR